MSPSQRRRLCLTWLAVLLLLGALAGLGYFFGAVLLVGFLVGLPAAWVHLAERRQSHSPRVFTHPRSFRTDPR